MMQSGVARARDVLQVLASLAMVIWILTLTVNVFQSPGGWLGWWGMLMSGAFFRALLSPSGWTALVMAAACGVARVLLNQETPTRPGLLVLLLVWLTLGFITPSQWLPAQLLSFVLILVLYGVTAVALAFALFATGGIGYRVLAVLAALGGAAVALGVPVLAAIIPAQLGSAIARGSADTPGEVMAVLGERRAAEAFLLSDMDEPIGVRKGCGRSDDYCTAALQAWNDEGVKYRLGQLRATWAQQPTGDGHVAEALVVHKRLLIVLVEGADGVGLTLYRVDRHDPSKVRIRQPPD